MIERGRLCRPANQIQVGDLITYRSHDFVEYDPKIPNRYGLQSDVIEIRRLQGHKQFRVVGGWLKPLANLYKIDIPEKEAQRLGILPMSTWGVGASQQNRTANPMRYKGVSIE